MDIQLAVKVRGNRVLVEAKDGAIRADWANLLGVTVEAGQQRILSVGETLEELRSKPLEPGQPPVPEEVWQRTTWVAPLTVEGFNAELALAFLTYGLFWVKQEQERLDKGPWRWRARVQLSLDWPEFKALSAEQRERFHAMLGSLPVGAVWMGGRPIDLRRPWWTRWRFPGA